MRRDVEEERRDVHCFMLSLSEQDLERVEGASARPFRDSFVN